MFPGASPHPHLTITTEFRLQSSPSTLHFDISSGNATISTRNYNSLIDSDEALFVAQFCQSLHCKNLVSSVNDTLGAGYVRALTVRWMEPPVTTRRRDHCGDVTPSHHHTIHLFHLHNTQFLFEAKFSSHPVSAQILHKS